MNFYELFFYSRSKLLHMYWKRMRRGGAQLALERDGELHV